MKTTPHRIIALVAVVGLCMAVHPAASQSAAAVAQPTAQPAPNQEVSPLTRHVFDSANQAISVTEKTANQTLTVAQAAIKAAETTMNEVRSAQTSLLSILAACVTILTAAGAYLGFKTLPDLAKTHIEKELDPKLKELDERLRQLGTVDTRHDATLAVQRSALVALQQELQQVRDQGQHEIAKFKENASKSMRTLSQVAFGDYLGIRATLLDSRTDEAKAMWHDSANWLADAAKNASVLEDTSMQSWLWLNLAYSQKRSDQPTAALASAEMACNLGTPDATALYNAACYAALCADKPKLLQYLERALVLEPSIADTLRPNPEHNVLGDQDLRAYWEDPDLAKLSEHFSPGGV